MHPSQYGKYFVVIILSALFGWFVLEHIGGWLTLILIAIGLWYWTLKRGMLTVKAFMYLDLLTKSRTPEEANQFVSTMTAEETGILAPTVKQIVQQYYGGKQLALIAQARNEGFTG
ncbi:MAG: hypothetical protein MK052_03985 [Alphaproteobacteria bacterium]|nr:hypothetical protein [Alphaproteobacteria bacterium]